MPTGFAGRWSCRPSARPLPVAYSRVLRAHWQSFASMVVESAALAVAPSAVTTSGSPRRCGEPFKGGEDLAKTALDARLVRYS